MSDDENRWAGSLIPFVGGKIVSRSTSLVTHGPDLLEGLKPIEDATTITQLRERANAEMPLPSTCWASHIVGDRILPNLVLLERGEETS